MDDYVDTVSSYETASYPRSYVGGSPFVSRFKEYRPPVARKKITIVKPSTPKRPSTAQMKTRFRALTREWRDAMLFESSPVTMATHPAYQRIIAMGAPVLPLVLDELKHKGGHWFWALRFLADADPVKAEDRGDYETMRQSWLAWWDDSGKDQYCA